MTVLGALRSKVGRKGDVSSRLEGLEAAVRAAGGRLAPSLVDDAEQVVTRARARMRLSSEHTVVALAGATGSGKSSLFNRLCGLDLAAVGVRRPTTSSALACSWGDGAQELLEWLGVPPRHQVNRASSLDVSVPEPDLQGLVLLDLPDHDSTEVSHHLEVQRLVGLADVIVWVLDPQKYADAAIHERFLRPLASHRDVMLVVFNHIDELSPVAGLQAVDDARRLLAADGLGDLRPIPTSATRGDGVGELRRELVKRVDQKRSARSRVEADIDRVARRLSAAVGTAEPRSLGGQTRDELVDACADAAGVPLVVAAVEESLVLRSRQATGWPPTRWVTRLRADPLHRLHLGRSGSRSESEHTAPVARSSLPTANHVQRARVASAVRQAADVVTDAMPQGWRTSTRAASVARLDDVGGALDLAVGRTDVAAETDPAMVVGGSGRAMAPPGVRPARSRVARSSRRDQLPRPAPARGPALALGPGSDVAARGRAHARTRRRSERAGVGRRLGATVRSAGRDQPALVGGWRGRRPDRRSGPGGGCRIPGMSRGSGGSADGLTA